MTVGIAALSALAVAGLFVWLRNSGDTAEPPRQGLAAALSEAGQDLAAAFGRWSEDQAVEGPRPGSMQESLLNATDDNRRHIFWRAIRDAGFECTEVRSAGVVGSGGSAWRANCGEASLYLVQVDEFGRLSAVPMPYGDPRLVEPPTPVFPQQEERNPQFRMPE